MDRKLTIGVALSRTGQYAAMGRQAEAALRLFVADLDAAGGLAGDGSHYRVSLDCFDDESRPDRTAAIYRELCFRQPRDLIFGPYSSALARVAAPLAEQAGLLMINHGGADDALHERHHRLIVSILTPASAYLVGFVNLLATLKFWRKRLAIASAQTPFADRIAAGIETAVKDRRIWLHGVRVRMKFTGAFEPERSPDLLARGIRRNRINAFVSAGSYSYDLAMMRIAAAQQLNLPVLACVAAGVDRFRRDLGDDAEGIIGPSQWEPDFQPDPEIGPSSAVFTRRVMADVGACDYPAAQIYAAGLLTIAALRAAGSPAPERLRAAFADLRTTTFFGNFAINRVTGKQIGHKMLLVQWHEGRKQIIEPDAETGGGDLEFPSGSRLLLASVQILKLGRRRNRRPPPPHDL